jgi:hypothetical protein
VARDIYIFICMLFLNALVFEFSAEVVVFQYVIIFITILFLSSNNNYYSLMYLFLLILLIGAVLCFLNNELTAGFLWVAEFLVIFVFLLLILYVNVHGDNKKFYNKHILFFSFIALLFLVIYEHDNTLMEDDLQFLLCDLYWTDYYEALNDYNNNDLYGFFISYYIFNSIILIIFGLILFFGSIICVTLFRLVKVVRFNNIDNFFDTIKYSQSFLYSIFMRKQDMFDQNSVFAVLKTIFFKND